MPIGSFPKILTRKPEANSPGQTPFVLEALGFFDAAFITLVVKSQTTGTPPAHVDGDAYLIPASGTTGEWVGQEEDIAFSLNSSWLYVTAEIYWRVLVEDEAGDEYEYDGANWRPLNSGGPVEAGITASTTQAQGQQPLTKRISQVSAVANPNDVVTLDAARAGLEQIVINDGANTLQIFPASGDSIDGGAVDASTTLAAAKRASFLAYDGTDHAKILGA